MKCDLDAFTHFRELASGDDSSLAAAREVPVKIAREAVLCAYVAVLAFVALPVLGGPRALFRPLSVNAAARDTAASQQVVLDVAAVDGEFVVVLHGVEFAVEIFRNADRPDGARRFRLEGSDALSTLVVIGGKAGALIHAPDATFVLYPAADSHLLQRIDESHFTCATPDPSPASSSQRLWRAVTTSAGKRRSVGFARPLEVAELRVGIRYHSRLPEQIGREEDVRLLANAAVAVLNTAPLETGQTGISAILASVENIDLTKSSSGIESHSRPEYSGPLTFDAALGRFADDPYVRWEKYSERLALMSYWDVIGAGGGIANLFEGQASRFTGFSVVGWHPEVFFAHFLHEIGHNLGLYHKKSSYPSPRRCSYCYAYENCSARIRDVMDSSYCFTRLQRRYSNWNRSVNGVIFGSEDSNAVRALQENRFLVRDSWTFAQR